MNTATNLPADWASGPLPRHLAEFPMRYAVATLVADLSPGGPRLNNGTATLIELGRSKLAITCAHVIKQYRDWLADRKAIFQIGNVKFEPIPQLLAEDTEWDLATIHLSDEQANVLEKNGAHFFVPTSWPPAPLKAGDWVAVGGFPGALRERVAWNLLDFTGYSIGATPVTSVSETKFVCRFERQRWVWSHHRDGLPDPTELGGMSGGPAFILRTLHWEFAGIVFEFSSTLDTMLLRPGHLIQQDGLI